VNPLCKIEIDGHLVASEKRAVDCRNLRANCSLIGERIAKYFAIYYINNNMLSFFFNVKYTLSSYLNTKFASSDT